MSRPFEKISQQYKGAKQKGCPVCGQKNKGQVVILLSELNSKGSSAGSRIGSRSISFCEEHASEAFLRLVKELEAARSNT